MSSEIRRRFATFFAAANTDGSDTGQPGIAPYPWQVALMEEVARTGRWPDIAAPTGSGKSAVVDIHTFLVAEHALGRTEVRPPRRLVLVAPRRILVDDQFERALSLRRRLQEALTDGENSPLLEFAQALEALCVAETSPAAPLGVWRLRGGLRLEPGWRLEPAACQIICATPQMWGSRLLFRGYGSTLHARNLETGLLAHDAIAIIDEAHLHERLMETARIVARRQAGNAALQAVSMTATGAAFDGRQISLTADDLANPELARRVSATKRVQVVEAGDFERHAWRAVVNAAQTVRNTGTVGVFVNDIPSALRVTEALRSTGTVELVCGRMRPADLAQLRQRRPTLLDSRGDPEVDFLVSTQSLEVGVDLDLPAMVTMLASPTALAQRAGRLNRSGNYGDSTLTVVVPPDADDGGIPERSGPYSRDDLVAGLVWLTQLEGSISPNDVMRAGVPSRARPALPSLRTTDLETLELTSMFQRSDPDPELYIQDPEGQRPEIQIAARAYTLLEPEVVASMLVTCPPRAHELVTIPLGKGLDRIVEVLGTGEGSWLLRAREGDLAAVPLAGAPEPGDVLVVPDGALVCTAGVAGLFSTAGDGEPLEDVLTAAAPDAAQEVIIPLDADAIGPIVASEPTLGSRSARLALAEVLGDEGHDRVAALLRSHRRLADLEVHWSGGAEAEVGLLYVGAMQARVAEAPAIVSDVAISLDAHEKAVTDRLEVVLNLLGDAISPRERDTLLIAARYHDAGKVHPRFQRRMGNGPDGVPLAKPAPGHRPDRGDGWRHEQLSTAFVAQRTEGDPLSVAVVGAHHGRGRALFDRGNEDLLDGWDACPPDVAAQAESLFGAYGRYEVLRVRARDEVGTFRLAWLEALLRCADIQVSREGG
jgi:CRISPR-associated endonuclease/helicase Cas3